MGGDQLENAHVGLGESMVVKTRGITRIWVTLGCVSRPQESGRGRGEWWVDVEIASAEVKVVEERRVVRA